MTPFLAVLKRWAKSAAMFCCGFFVASMVLLLSLAALGAKIRLNAIGCLAFALLFAAISFLPFWGWFSFRSKKPLDSLRWFELAGAGASIMPLLFIFSLPPLMLGLIKAAPAFFNAALPLFTIFAVSETASWAPRIRERMAKQAAAKASSPERGAASRI